MLNSMGWGLFLFYFFFDVVMAFFCWFSFKETRNKTLETVNYEFDHKLGGSSAFTRSDSDDLSEGVGRETVQVDKQ